MAIVPQALASVLDQILPDEAAVAEAAQAHQRALTLMGPSAARPIVEDLEVHFPNHPGTLYLRAIQQLEDGRTGKALAGFRTLLEMFPRSSSVRVRLIGACRQLGGTALMRETLRSIVETGRIPGVNSQSDWASPHPGYPCDYADLLRFSSESRDRAESLLQSVLRNNWRSAIAWHVLADLRWGARADESAVLAYRIASTTAEHNEHYARAYADALARTNRLTCSPSPCSFLRLGWKREWAGMKACQCLPAVASGSQQTPKSSKK
jgi:tetratricopeptide (TPR) repeat protein